MTTVTTQDYGAALLRVSLGLLYLAHSAVLKLAVFTMAGTAQFFQSLGLPAWTAYATVGVELVAGTMLVLGWHSRLAAAAVLPIAIGATWTHAGNGWVFSGAGGGWEFPLFLVVLSLVQILLGNGAFALQSARAPGGFASARTAAAI